MDERCRPWSEGVAHLWLGGDGWDVHISVACILACFIIAASTLVLLVLYVSYSVFHGNACEWSYKLHLTDFKIIPPNKKNYLATKGGWLRAVLAGLKFSIRCTAESLTFGRTSIAESGSPPDAAFGESTVV